MSLLRSVVVITTIVLLSPSATISAISLCFLLYFAHMSGAIQFNRPSEFNAIHIPEPLPEIEDQRELISRLAKYPAREDDEDVVQKELKWRDKSQSPSVTLAQGPFPWQRVTNGPPAAGYPIQVLHDHEHADLEYVGMI